MIKRSPKIQLIPYCTTDWEYLASLYYNPKYRSYFRNHMSLKREYDFQNYLQILGGEGFLIIENETKNRCGFVHIIPDIKPARVFYTATLLEEDYQAKGYILDALILAYDYMFNTCNFTKAIAEVLSTDERINKSLQRAGFTSEGVMYKEAFINGQYVDENRYSMFSDYFNNHYKNIIDKW